MPTSATAQEERALRKDMERGRPLRCPRCHEPLRATPVPPRSDVSYVRNRVILDCEGCGLRAALDKR